MWVGVVQIARERRVGRRRRGRTDAHRGQPTRQSLHLHAEPSPPSPADEPRGATRSLSQWTPVLPITPLGPAQRHLFLLSSATAAFTHLKLTMHPDGGLGRFRAYGHVHAPPLLTSASIDLAHVLHGGTVTGESDQHFGRGGNLILPGRGVDMGDGWETKRSRGRLGKGLGDWVVLRLAQRGWLDWVDLDTSHFVGNFPESAALHGIVSDEVSRLAHPARRGLRLRRRRR